MSDSVMISEQDSNRIQVRGLLSIETVADYLHEGYALLDKMEGHVTFDLSDAEVVGSAAIALLISWQKRAIQLKLTFGIENASAHLLEVAAVSGVREIIAFEESVQPPRLA